MKIRLESVVDRPFDWQETLTLDADVLGHSDLESLGDIAVRGRVSSLSGGYLLEATLSYIQTLRCNRCLERFDLPVSTEVKLMLEVSEPSELSPDLELVPDDLGLLQLSDLDLETLPIWLEQLHLAVPMKPLCRDDCGGLCSTCGARLDDEACSCKPSVDPRWAALAALSGGPASEH